MAIMDQKDGDRHTETETERDDCGFRIVHDGTESISFYVDGSGAPLSGEMFNYRHQGCYRNMKLFRLNIQDQQTF